MTRLPPLVTRIVGSDEVDSGSGTRNESAQFRRLAQERDGVAGLPPARNRNSEIRKCHGGEGGIRTLGTLLGYGALAKRCFRPLSHLTNRLREYEVEGYSST